MKQIISVTLNNTSQEQATASYKLLRRSLVRRKVRRKLSNLLEAIISK
jgi:hypothetical protein